jgi:hypothetical protein
VFATVGVLGLGYYMTHQNSLNTMQRTLNSAIWDERQSYDRYLSPVNNDLKDFVSMDPLASAESLRPLISPGENKHMQIGHNVYREGYLNKFDGTITYSYKPIEAVYTS